MPRARLERRLEALESKLSSDEAVATMFDFSPFTVDELLWLEEVWEGVPNDATAAEKHPERVEEFKRRLAILIKETEHRR